MATVMERQPDEACLLSARRAAALIAQGETVHVYNILASDLQVGDMILVDANGEIVPAIITYLKTPYMGDTISVVYNYCVVLPDGTLGRNRSGSKVSIGMLQGAMFAWSPDMTDVDYEEMAK